MAELGEGLSGYLDVQDATLRAPRLEAVSNIGIANTAPRHAFSVGSNLYVSTESSNVLTVNGNVACEGIKMGLIEITPSYDLAAVSNVGNVTQSTIQFSNATTGFVTTSNVEIGGDLVVSGNTTVSTDLTVSANAQIGRDLVVSGNTTVSTDLTVSGNTTVSTDLTVSANATVADTLTISEHLIASKEATVTGNLHVTTIRSDSNVVTEYTGPHDRPLRKYPEVALSVTSESASGEYGYKVSWSSIYDNGNNVNERPFRAFDGDIGNTGIAWMVPSGVYGSDGTYAQNPPRNLGTATGSSTTVNGEYIILQTPNKIKVKHFRISDRSTNTDRAAEAGKLYGSNDGSTWYELASFSGLTYFDGDYYNTVQVNAATYYDRLALVVTNSTATSTTYMGIGELEYYGYEEGDSSLDTTLKTVYNVPATTGTQLEVYYDGQDYTSGSTITDKVANANATISSGSDITFDSTWKAWTFSSSTTRTQSLRSGTLPTSLTSSSSISAALWFKFGTTMGDRAFFHIADPQASRTANQILEIRGNVSQGYRFQIWDGQYTWQFNPPFFNNNSYDIPTGEWYHLAMSITDSSVTGRKLYFNGVECDLIDGSRLTVATASELNLPSDAVLELGRRPGEGVGNTVHDAGNEFDGSIANFRLYSKALNADQVKELYDYQKDYFLGSKSQVTLYKGHLGVGGHRTLGPIGTRGR